MLKALVLLQQMSSAAVHRVLHRKAVILACVSPCAWSAWSAAVDIHHCAGTSEVPAGHDAGVGHHSTVQNKVRASRDDGMLVMLTPCMLLTCSAAASFATGGTCDLTGHLQDTDEATAGHNPNLRQDLATQSEVPVFNPFAAHTRIAKQIACNHIQLRLLQGHAKCF